MNDDRSRLVRERALRILYRVDTEAAYSNRLLDAVARDDTLNRREQAMVHQLVKGTLERRGTLDWVLNRLVRNGMDSLTPWIRNVLRLGAYQLVFMENISRQSAVYQSVELAKRYGHRGTSGLVNAVLHKVPKGISGLDLPNLNQDPVAHVAISYSHPEWMVRRWIDQIGLDNTIALCKANNEPWPVCVRTNTLRNTTAELRAELSAENVEWQPAHYDPDCTIILKLPQNQHLHELAAYGDGRFQVQDESSALVGRLVAPRPGETVVDLCAAPGGKTTHMAASMRNRGRIIAVDAHPGKVELVLANCRRLGITIVQGVCADGRELRIEEQVDRVLVDAPCSGLGTLGRHSDTRWQKSESETTRLASIQQDLLDNAARLLRTGGRLVYSTCTIEPDENERTVERFIGTHPNFQRVDAGELVPSELVSAEGYYRTWPHEHGVGGAFGAVMVKNAR